MGWTSWSRKAAEPPRGSDSWVGLDLNSSRLRMMTGDGQRIARPVMLDEPHEEFPLAAAFPGKNPEWGHAALAVERRWPHLFLADFLHDVNLPRRWEIGRHRYTSAELLGQVFQRLRPLCPRTTTLTAVLPAYLTSQKVTILAEIMDRCRLPIRGSALLPLALTATHDLPDRRPVTILVIDADDHALTASLVSAEEQQVRLLSVTPLPRLNLRTWKNWLLAGLADRCVRVCRRDPRDSAATEQALFEQLDAAMDILRRESRVELVIRSTHWYQTLLQTADDFAGYCANLVKTSLAGLRELLQPMSGEPPALVWFTHAAGRLPGLMPAVESFTMERTAIEVLPADAGCRAALLLAGRWSENDLPRTHLDTVIPRHDGMTRESSPSAYRPANSPPGPRVWRER